MQSEHLTSLHPGWVIGGWMIAAAVTAGLYLAGVGLGLVLPGSGAVIWVAVSMASGFFVGGLFVGLRWTDAPILHGAAITFFSVFVWFFASFFDTATGFGPLSTVLGLILLQLVSSTAGGWMGRRMSVGVGGSA